MLPLLSIELGHIYADQEASEEHFASIYHARNLIEQFKSQGTVVTTILVDDLHIERNNLDLDRYIKSIEDKGITVDHVVFESKLSTIARHIVRILPEDRLKWESFKRGKRKVLNFYPESGGPIGLRFKEDDRDEFSCTILSAAWSLCRLGIYPFPSESIINLTDRKALGINVVSVLHCRFEDVERKVLTIIKACGFDIVVPRLRHIFFET